MIILGGRKDVVAQWFTKRFINKQAGLFKGVVIGPGECAIIIRNGKAERPVTQEQIKGVSAGLMDSIKTKLGGGEDFQMLVVDVRPKVVILPFKGYSKDRSRIEGEVHVTFRTSPSNAMNIIYMMTGPTGLDHLRDGTTAAGPNDRYHSSTDLRQLTVEDIADRLGPDLGSKLYAEVISQTSAADFHENALAVSQAMLAVVERSRPFWSEYGLEVIDHTCNINLNAQEDALREEVEAKRKQEAKAKEKARAKESADDDVIPPKRKADRRFHLIHIDAHNQERQFEMDGRGSVFREEGTNEVMVRSKESTTSLGRHDLTVSRDPVEFLCEEGKVQLCDRRKGGKKETTCINGKSIPVGVLRVLVPGDVVVIGGSVTFRVEMDPDILTVKGEGAIPISKEMSEALDPSMVLRNGPRFYLDAASPTEDILVVMGERRVRIILSRNNEIRTPGGRSDTRG